MALADPSTGLGQPKRDACATTGRRVDRDGAAVRLDDSTHDREPEARAAGLTTAGLVEPNEPLEHLVTVGGGDAGPVNTTSPCAWPSVITIWDRA